MNAYKIEWEKNVEPLGNAMQTAEEMSRSGRGRYIEVVNKKTGKVMMRCVSYGKGDPIDEPGLIEDTGCRLDIYCAACGKTIGSGLSVRDGQRKAHEHYLHADYVIGTIVWDWSEPTEEIQKEVAQEIRLMEKVAELSNKIEAIKREVDDMLPTSGPGKPRLPTEWMRDSTKEALNVAKGLLHAIEASVRIPR